MSLDSTAIQQLAKECQDNVEHLDEYARKWRQVEDGTFDFAALIPKELYGGENGTQVPIIKRRQGLRNDTEVIQSVVGWPARISVDLPKVTETASRLEDEFEAFFAYSSHMCDPRGHLKSNIHNFQALWPYSGVWQSVVPYAPPKKRRSETTEDYEYRKKSYDKHYWRYKWEVPIPSHYSFLDRGGDANTACIYEELPVLDFMDLYAEREDEDDYTPLTLFQEQFPWLRATDGSAPDRDNANDWFNGHKKIRRWLVDNGSEIYHCVQYGDKREMYKHLEVPNTFGRCSFVLIHGTYRPGGEVPYASLVSEIAQAYYNVTMLDSLYHTMLANDKWLTALDPSVAQDIARQVQDNPDTKIIDQYQVKIQAGMSNPVIGTPVHANNLPEKWWDSVQNAEAQLQQARAPLMNLIPDDVTQRNAPAANVLAAQTQGLRPWEKPTTSWTTAFETLFTMQGHDIVYGLNPHLANVGESKDNNRNMRGEKSEYALEFLAGDYTEGNYQTSSRIPKGKGYKLTPEDFKQFCDEGSVKVEFVADTDATRAARVQIKMAELNNQPPLATPADVWTAEGITDTTKKAKEINLYIMFQHMVPKLENMTWMHFLERVAAREGRSVPEMAALVGAMPPMGQNGDMMPSPRSGLNTTSVAAPAGPTPNTGGSF